MKLSIVIVSWNVREHLLPCLRSVETNRPQGESEVIVVDNASCDGTIEALRHDFPAVQVIANKENRGFAAANNQAIQASRGQYVLLLNPDTLLHPNALDLLIQLMDNSPDVGACAPRLLNGDGSIQRSLRRFPTFGAALHQHTIFKVLGLFRRPYNRWRMKDFTYDRQADVDQPMGAALLVRHSVIDQVGPMDERFFMYYEEVDWCARIKEHGWRIVFTPAAEITHYGGESSRRIPRSDRRLMLLRSSLAFLRKHRGRCLTAAFDVFFKPAILLGEVYSILKAAIAYLGGLLVRDGRQQSLAAAEAKESAKMLTRDLWMILFSL